ncbi:hypothetical protein ACHAW6_001653 [Cyclotella cf. meneghiniana]
MSPNTTNAQTQGLALIEEWPIRESPSESPDAVLPSKIEKRVSFSTYSRARFYKCSSSYRANMSYTSADCKMFRVRVAREGLRIQRLVSSCPSTKPGSVIHDLVEQNVLSREELIGIEHLVTKDAPARLLYERRAHTATVLKAQKEMHERNDIDKVDELARVAIANSSRSIQKARLRSALAT